MCYYIVLVFIFQAYFTLYNGHWEDPEVWGGEGGRRRDQDGEHMYIHG